MSRIRLDYINLIRDLSTNWVVSPSAREQIQVISPKDETSL